MNDEDDLTIQASEDMIARLRGQHGASSDATNTGDAGTDTDTHTEDEATHVANAAMDADLTMSNDPTVHAGGELTLEPASDPKKSLVWEPPGEQSSASVRDVTVAPDASAQAPFGSAPTPDDSAPAIPAAPPTAGGVPGLPEPVFTPTPQAAPDTGLASLAPNADFASPDVADSFFDREPYMPESRVSPALIAIAGVPLVLLIVAVIWYFALR